MVRYRKKGEYALKPVKSAILYRKGEFLKKKVKKLIPIMIIVLILSTSFSPMVFAKKNVDDVSSDHPKIKVLKRDTERPFKALLVGFMERLVERFPKLASLPVFQKLLGNEENSNSSSSDTSEDDENDSQSNTSNINDNSDTDSKGGRFIDRIIRRFHRSPFHSGFQDLSGTEEESDDDDSQEDEGSETGSADGESNSSTSKDISGSGVNEIDNSTKWVIPESGHLQITGNISIEIANGMFYVDNHTILLSGKFHLESKDDSVDIWWNLTQGFFKINGSRHFEIENLYFDVDGKLVVKINSLIIDGQGYFTINRFGDERGLFLNGVRELESLSVSIDVERENIPLKYLSGSFNLSSVNQANEFSIQWGKNGFSADGFYTGNTHLDIYDFCLIHKKFRIYADLVSFYNTADFEFIQAGETTLCSIVSDDLRVSGLYLKYGNYSLFLNSTEVHGVLNLTLHIDGTGDEYVTARDGHIIISGNMVMNVNTTIDVNGITVKLQGELTVETNSDSIEIWWNTTRGFFKITSTSLSVLGNLHVAIEEDWLELNLGNIIMDSEASITLDKVNGHSHLKFDGIISLRAFDFTVTGNIKDNSITLHIGSIYFGADGNVDLLWNNGISNLTAYASCDYGLIIHNISAAAAGISGEVSTLTLQGEWKLSYNNTRLLFTVNGSLQLQDFSVGNVMSTCYLYASGSVKILVKGGVIELWLSGGSSLYIGEGPLGSFTLSARGKLYARIDLTTGEIYGEFGFRGWIFMKNIMVTFSGYGNFTLRGDWLVIRTTIDFGVSFSMRFTFCIYEIRISGAVSGVAQGRGWAVISINLKTGEIYMRYGYSMKIYAVVYGIYAEGTDVSIPTKRFKLHMETFVLDARSAAISIRLDGFNIMTARFSGRIPATVEIRNLTMMSTTNLSEAPMMLSIERIYAKGDFLIRGTKDRINIEGDVHLDVQNLRFNVVNAADSNLQFNIDAFIDSISLDSGRISITIENVLSTPEVSITFTGSSVEVSDIEFSGNVIIPGIPGEENNQFSLDFEGSVDSVVLEDGELSISLRLNRDLSLASLNVEGSGVITVSNISLGGEAGNETTTFGSLSASIDIVTLNGDFSVHYDNGDLMIEASATLTIEDIEIGGEVMNTSFNASVTTVNFTAAGSLNVYSNGTVEAECEGSLVVDGITVSIGEEEITIENINIEFGGKLVIHPGETEDEPPIYEVNGHVEWNITGDIESEGNVTVDANVTIQFDKFDDGNFTINISFDGEINMNVSLNGATPGLGNFSLNIENYSGDGMFEFYWNTSEGKIYLNNSMDASWDSFYFNVADGFIEGEIYEFTGDITIENLFIDQEALGEMRDDPRNWTIKSENGYDTVLGFSFSSNGGLNLEGDIYADLGAYLDLSIRRLHCDPGTVGEFTVERDAYGNIRITLNCESGAAVFEFSLYTFGLEITCSLNSTEGHDPIIIPYGLIVAMVNKDWAEVGRILLDSSTLELLASLHTMGVLIDGMPIIEWLLATLPEYLRDLLERLLEDIMDDDEESCFLAGTKIMMADGNTKNIEDIKVGDLIRSYDPVSGEFKVGVVTKVFHHAPEEMTNYYLLINDELRVTPNHPVYVSGRWIKAEELRVGDVFGGNTIYSIERIYQRVPTYNFEVEPYHTYIIIWGENAGSVVHNANATTQLNETQVKVKKILIKAGVSADKYYSPSVKADAGVKTKVEVSKKVVTNSTKKIVIKNVVHVIPKTYENKKGEKVRVDDISVVVNESGEYSVQKKQQSGKVVTVKTGLKSSQEVVNYIEKSIVNKDSSTSHQNSNGNRNSNGNNNNVNDDEDINDDEDTCCFPAGTMITMADGSLKPIEDVRVGDSVLSYDVKNQRTTVCRVLEKVAPVRAGVYSINNGLVYVTDDHPFYTLKRDGRVGWAAINPEHTEYGYSMSVLPLKVGDKLFTQKGEWVTVNSIVYEPGPIQTYNLEDVSGKSTFFANGLLVHNAVHCNNDSYDSRGVLYGYYKEVSTVVLSDEPLSFEGENDLDVWLAIEVPIEFNGSGSYIADDDKEFNGSRGYVADDDKSVNSGKTAGGSGVLPSTKIVMADGSTKCIHSIKVGDLVRSYDPPSRRTVNARVTQVCKYAGDEMGEYYLIIKFKSKVPYTQKQFYIRQGDDGKEKVIHSLILSPLLHGMKFSTDGTSPRIIERRYRDSVEGVAVGELRLTPTHLVYVKTAPGEYKLVAAASVKTGYTLVGMHGELVVSSVQKVFKKSVTYSVKLDRYGAYFANGVLVQNIDVSADARLAIADDDKQQKPEPMDVDDNEIAVYIWDFGDGTIGYGENPRHIYHVDVPFVPLTAGDVKEVELCGALYEGSTNGLRDVDIKKTPTGIRTSRDPWVPGQPTVDRKPVEDDNRVTSTIQPTYVTRKVTYPVTLVVIDKYGRIGVDTTEITITVPVPTQPIQDGYLSDVYYKSIEDVKVGDWVKTVDLKSKKFVNARVTEVMHHTASEMNSCYLAIRFKPALPRFELDRGSVPTKKCESVDTIMDRDYMLEVTPNHLICVVPPSASSVNNIAYKWVSAGSLKVGDVTYSVTGEKIVVSSIEKVYRRVDTYNIKVESYGTYFANGILVQDKTSPEIPVSSVCFLAGTQIMMAKNPYVAKNPYEEKEIKDDPHLTRLDELFSQLILQSF